MTPITVADEQQPDPGAEAWHAMGQFFLRSRSRMLAVSQEHELTPPQMQALRILEPGGTRTMREVADALFCDPSNVTGIVDRLEARGLIERRAAPHDRRAKLLAVTPEGERVRADVINRLSQPPHGIAALPAADQRTLRDIMRKALTAAAEFQQLKENEQPPSVRT